MTLPVPGDSASSCRSDDFDALASPSSSVRLQLALPDKVCGTARRPIPFGPGHLPYILTSFEDEDPLCGFP